MKHALPNRFNAFLRFMARAFLALALSCVPSTAAPFTPGNLVIYRVGDGSGSLLNTGAAVFLDEYSSAGTLVQSISMPTSASGGSFGLVASGTATSEGGITRSADGRYLALTGYNASIPHTSSLTGTFSSSVFRSIGRVSWDGTVDISTVLQDFSDGGSPRAAFTLDGNSFWLTGGAGGPRHAPFGTNTTSTQLSTVLSNLRWIHGFGGQLYATTGSGSAVRLGSIGNGFPTTPGQSIANLPGYPTTGGPYGFFMTDLSASVAGNDTLYVADDTVGITKYCLVDGTWISNGSVGGDADDYRGLTATVSGSTVILFATRNGGSTSVGGGELVILSDASGHNGTIAGTPTLLATAAANTAFRGVAFAPVSDPAPGLEFNIPGTTGELAKIDIGHFVGGSRVRLVASGQVNLGDDVNTFADGALVSPTSYAFINEGSTGYPQAFGGDGTNHFPGGGFNYFDGFAFAGKLTTDTTDPEAIRIGSLVGTFAENPAREDWFLIGTDNEIVIPAGGANLRVAVLDLESGNNTGAFTLAIREAAQLPDLTIEVTAPATIPAEEAFTYLVTARNTGVAAAEQLRLRFTVPDGLAILPPGVPTHFIGQFNGRTFECTGNTFPFEPGAEVTFEILVSGTPGIYTIAPGAAEIDPADLVTEADETNNLSQESIQTVVGGAVPEELVHRWSFNDITDSVGGADLTLEGSASLVAGQLELPGSAVPRVNYASVPIGSTISGLTNMTVEAWFTMDTLANWSKVWMFGTPSGGIQPGLSYLAFTPRANTIPRVDFDLPTTVEWNTGLEPNPPALLPSTAYHVVSVYDATHNQMRLFIDGVLVDSASMEGGNVGQMGTTTENFFGAAVFWQDPDLDGRIDEMRIWDRPLTGTEIASSHLSGPEVLPEIAPSEPSIVSSPTGRTIYAGESATLLVVAEGSPLPVYQWYQGTSGDTSQPVVGATSASFTTPPLQSGASYWVEATNIAGAAASVDVAVIVLPIPAGGLRHRWSFDDASDSAGGATLSLVGNASLAGGQLELPGSTEPRTHFATLPIGETIASLTSMTVETWFTLDEINMWSKLWLFAQDNSFVQPGDAAVNFVPRYGNNVPQLGFDTAVDDYRVTDFRPVVSPLVPGVQFHVAAVFDVPNDEMRFYIDGVLADAVGMGGGTVGQIGNTPFNFLGAESFFADPDIDGRINEMRIWDRPLGAEEIARSITAGPDQAFVSPSITTQPAGTTIAKGQSATLSVLAGGSPPPAFQWYRGQSGDTSDPIADATSADFITPALDQATSFWVRASNDAGATDSDTATILVDLIANGSFEDGPAILGNLRVVSAPNESTIPDWNVSAYYVVEIAPGTWPASSGLRSISLNGTLSQTVTGLEPGKTYRLSFDLSGNPYEDAGDTLGTLDFIKDLRVTAGGVSSAFQFDVSPFHWTGGPVAAMGWSRRIMTFVATSTVETITFISLDPPASTRTAAIDNISLVEETEPEVGVPPVISTQPVATQTIAQGSSVSLAVAASGFPAPMFQWYRGQSGDTSQLIEGATNAFFTTPPLTATTSYWVRATNPESSADSNTATVSIPSNNANLAGLSLSPGEIVPLFDPATMNYSWTAPYTLSSVTVTAVPQDPQATMGVRSGVGAYTDLNSNEASGPILLNIGLNEIEVRVSAEDGTTKTYRIDVTRPAPPPADLAVSLSAPATVPVGQDFDYTITITNLSPTAGNGSFTVMLVIPEGIDFVAFPAATNTINGVYSTGTFNGEPARFAGFTKASLFGNESIPLKVRVRGNTPGSFTAPAGSLFATQLFFDGDLSNNASPADVTTTIFAPPSPASFTVQPLASQTIPYNATATLTVEVAGNPAPTLQWYRGESGDLSNPVGGATSASFTTQPLVESMRYWVQAINSSGPPANSNTAVITVSPPLVPEIVVEEPVGTELEYAEIRDFGSAMVGTPAPAKTFTIRNSGTATLEDLSAIVTGPGYSISTTDLPSSLAPGASTTLTVGYTPVGAGGPQNGILRVLSNDADEAVFAISLRGTGTAPPAFTVNPQPSQTIINGAFVTLTSAASGYPLPAYQWYQGLSGNTSNEVAGATSPDFTTPPLLESTSYWVRASNTHGSADSQTAFVEVEPISSNAALSALVPSAGILSPGFNANSAFYTLLVPGSVAELTFTPVTAHPAATVSVNGAAVASGAASQVIPIAFGQNPVNVVVTAQDGETIRSYLINANRAEPMFITTGSASGVSRTSATMNGTIVPNGTATVRFEYGTSTAYGFSTPPQQATGTNLIDVQTPLTDLLPGTRYHFRMLATNGVDTVAGANQFFDTQPGAPLVITGNPVDVTTATAKLVGAVDGRGQDVRVYFEYGTDFPPTQSTAEQVIPAAGGYTNVFTDIAGLTANAVYQVRLVARVGTDPPIPGNYRSFTATESGGGVGTPTGPPEVTTGEVVSITTGSAEIRGNVNAMGGTTAVWIEYGPTPLLGLRSEVVREIGNTVESAAISIPIGGLVSGTGYHYKVVAQNSLGIEDGLVGTFQTNFLPPAVSTGAASVLSTTSVRVFGTVRANRAAATVRFRYGTSPGNLDLLIDAAPASVGGDVNTAVSADLANLRQGTRYYYLVEAGNSGGDSSGSARSFDVAVLSGLDRRFPDFIEPSAHQGSLRVDLTPPATGGWRFAGEIGWREPGSTATGLATGDRRIEYRPAAGFLTPPTETLAVNSQAGLQAVARAYVSTSTPGSGRLRVSIKPDSLAALTNAAPIRAQWRLAGEPDSAWRDSDTEVAGLVPGSHFIESKPVAGFETPAPVNASIADGQTTLAAITYFLAADPVGTVPVPVPFATVAGESSQPFGFVGQILSDAGASTGFVVKRRVVATAGHVVFDDGTLSAVTNVSWLFQREAGVHEPVPIPPRGFYLMSGYAAQRALDDSPGVSSPASQNLDAAALYFTDNAIGRNGYSGYLASDLAENEFLLSDRDKLLAGYPVEGVAAAAVGRLHATPAADIDFSPSFLRTYLTTGIRGSGGISGGPLFVREPSGIWYPAAIYLGGTRQAIVRAIDSDVADLFGFAESSAESVEGSTGGSGSIGAASPLPTPDLGGIRVVIEPAAARNAGARWRINSGDPYQPSSTQIVDLNPNSYTVRFSTVPGFLPPVPQGVAVAGGQLSVLTFTYQEQILPPAITSPSSVTLVRGQSLFYQISTSSPADTYSLFGPLPPGVEFDPALGRITGIPQTAGVFLLQAGATNEGGSGSKSITVNILPAIAAQNVSATKGAPLNHPLASGETGGGLTWSSSPLPEGLLLDPDGGLVTGVPLAAGVFTANISLTRNGATASAPATFTILGEAPVFTLEPPVSRAIEFGTSTTFVVSATGEPPPVYQWYRGASGNTANPVVGATSATFVTPLLVEPASFWVRATSFGRTADSRAVSISLLASANAELASLETDAGLPSPFFNPAVTSYRITVPNATSTIRLLPVARVSQTSILVDGQPVVSGSASAPVAVAPGTSRIILTATAGDGITARVYTLDVTRLPSPSSVTDPATLVSDFSARLNGRVTPNGLGEAFFEYGPTIAYGARTPRQAVSGDQPVFLSSDVAGLEPLTVYHFRMVLEAGGQALPGNDLEFTTNRKPPAVATGNVFRSTTADATLTGAVNPNGQNVTLFFEFGLGTQPGGRTSDFAPPVNGGTSAVDVSFLLTGLQAGNPYSYRLVAVDEAGVEWRGAIESFTAENSAGTADGIADSPPTVVTGAATDLTTTSATLAGLATPNDGSTEVWFEYGTTGGYGETTPIQLIGNGGQPRGATWQIAGLVPEQIYHFRMVARNGLGETQGTDVTFQTRFNPPVVSIGSVEALSPTSVKITGTVDPKGASTTVDFRYGRAGEGYELGATASQGVQTGAGARPVSVVLTNLEPSFIYQTFIETTSDGGPVGSDPLTFQPGALIGLIQQFPEPTPATGRSGQVTVNLLPDGTGAWRFAGESQWRASGIPATGLTTGDRIIEFRPETGYNRPPSESVSVVSGGPAVVVESLYYTAPEPGLAAITVQLEPSSISDPSLPPASRAQWRFAGVAGDPWKDSGTTVSQLPEGSYLIECKPVTGRQTPLHRSVALANDENRSIAFTYFTATGPILLPPAPVSYETAVADPTLASGFVGQVRGDLGTSSGFAVKRRVVATAAQAVFDEATLSLTGNLEWLWLPDRGNHEPKPLAARGVYIFDGYASRRATEGTPGTLSTTSQNLNVAAIYFAGDAARGGASGFLASDETENPYLVSAYPKMLAGYPSVGVSPTNLGRLHVSSPSEASFAVVTGRTYDTAAIRGLGGMAGGPLSVRPETGGTYYPAAIYVGGTSRGIVRAIDTPVIDLFSRAEVSGNGGDNDTGGGITHTSFAAIGSSDDKGAVIVTIRPAAARNAGAGWRLSTNQSFKDSGDQIGNLSPGDYTLRMSTVSGFPDPPNATVKVKKGQTTEIIFDYSEINTAPVISSLANRTINEDSTTGAIAFTIGDDQSSAGSLTISRSSSNVALVSNANIVIGGSGANRTVTVTPEPNQSGTAVITITVSDGTLTATRAFTLTVNPVNDPPTLTAIANQNAAPGVIVGPLAFTIADIETSVSLLTVTSVSTNHDLVPPAAITLGGAAGNRTITIIPQEGQLGSTTITLTVSDGAASASRNFLVTVGGSSLEVWRFANFGISISAGDAGDDIDADGDGSSNRAEFAAGTDPNDPADVFRVLTTEQIAGTFRLVAAGKAGRRYSLLRGFLHDGGSWTVVATTGPLATNQPVELTDSLPPANNGFYRLQVDYTNP